MHCTYVFIRHMWLKSRLCVFISIHGHRHAHLFLSVLSTSSLYFFLKSFFHLFLNPAMVPDENSMEDPLCNSSFGSMVSLDYVTPDTEPYAPGKDFDDWDFTFNGYAGTLDPAYPALLKAARQSPKVVMATNSTLQPCCTFSRCSHSREESWKQRLRSVQTTVPEVRNKAGTVRANHDVQVRFQDRRRGRPSERISGTGETIRRGERCRSRSRSSEKGAHHFEHARASEDTSSAERGQTGKLQRITRGD